MEITSKDLDILNLLRRCRYATTKQLVSLFFNDSQHQRTAFRRCNLATKKLKELGFIDHLERRIGGIRSGSGSYIWTIRFKGLKYLKQLDPTILLKYRNRYEPTFHQVEHQLAITQVFVSLKALETKNILSVEKFSFEPQCWRNYTTLVYSNKTLKPDAFTKVVLQEFEDSYFIEVDNSTEHLGRIIAKCKQYITYFNTGIEQRETEIFPFVLWIVPSDKRKETIQHRIKEDLENYWELFLVVTLDDFPAFIQGGIKNEE